MGGKKEKSLEKIEVAKELARLSGQLADGFIELDGRRVELPEKVLFKKVLKTKKKEVYFELSIKTKSEQSEVKEERKGKGKRQGGRPGERQGKRPYKAKRLKKEIGMYWKALKRCVKSGERFRDKEGFIRAMSNYSQGAEKEWADQWEKCTALVKEVIELAENGDVDTAIDKCKQVDELTKACHKQFK